MSSAEIPSLPPRSLFSTGAMTVFAAIAAATFSVSSSAPTPLYRLYQESLHLTPFLLTLIFAVYAFSLLAALLTVGSLSDHIGRRPVILATLLLNALAMALFALADTASMLIAARLVQGFATGAATTTLGAAILDTDRQRGPLLNSITAFAGLSVGTLGAGALATYAPAPAELVYLVLLGFSVLLAALLLGMPETMQRRPGALASLLPHIHVPSGARTTLVQLTPANVATWALGGFYFSLMPSLVRVATGLTAPIIGGIVVASLTLTAALAVVMLRALPAERILRLGTLALAGGIAVTLAGVHAHFVALIFAGAIVAGVGFGASFSGTLRSLLPLASAQERAGLLSAFYVESYLAFSLPAILAGLAVPTFGLPAVATVYGGVTVLLALTSFMATPPLPRRSTACPAGSN